MKEIFAVIFGVIVLITIGLSIRGGALLSNKFFAPKEEAVRREVFEQSKAFNQGAIQELSTMYREYHAPGTSESQRKAIKSVVLHQTADFNIENFPPYLYGWISQLRQEM